MHSRAALHLAIGRAKLCNMHLNANNLKCRLLKIGFCMCTACIDEHVFGWNARKPFKEFQLFSDWIPSKANNQPWKQVLSLQRVWIFGLSSHSIPSESSAQIDFHLLIVRLTLISCIRCFTTTYIILCSALGMAPRARNIQKQFSRLIDDVGEFRVENQNTHKIKYLPPNGTRGNSQQKYFQADHVPRSSITTLVISMCASAHYGFPQLL